MWGYDSPARFDMVQITESRRPSGHDQMMTTIRQFIDRLPPAQKALRRRLEELGSPERALELLGLPKPIVDGDGAGGPVDAT